MSRTPCIAAHAIGRVRGESPIRVLVQLSQAEIADVSPGLWSEAVSALAESPESVEISQPPVPQG